MSRRVLEDSLMFSFLVSHFLTEGIAVSWLNWPLLSRAARTGVWWGLHHFDDSCVLKIALVEGKDAAHWLRSLDIVRQLLNQVRKLHLLVVFLQAFQDALNLRTTILGLRLFLQSNEGVFDFPFGFGARDFAVFALCFDGGFFFAVFFRLFFIVRLLVIDLLFWLRFFGPERFLGCSFDCHSVLLDRLVTYIRTITERTTNVKRTSARIYRLHKN